MSDEAEVTMALYVNLSAKEENTLKSIEGDIMNLTLKKRIVQRLIWTSTTSASNRFIQPCMYDKPQPKVLFELEAGEFANISKEELITQLQNSSIN